MKRAGKRLRSTKQPLCDSFSSGNVGKGVFGASRFAFLNRGRLAPKQSKNTSGARPERRCGLRECDLGRGATQMPVRNERAQAQGTITVDPLLASPPPPEIAPPCARRATNRLSRTASQGGGRPREGRASSLPHRERSGGRPRGAAQPTAPAARRTPSAKGAHRADGAPARTDARPYNSPMMRAVRAAHSALARSRSIVGHCPSEPAEWPSAR